MVHGGGHCSGGGGGGFSGGGVTTTVYSTNYYSSGGIRYGSRGGGQDCDCSWCKVCCLAITCVSLKPKSRIRFLWFLVIVFSLIVGLSVSLGHYGKHSIDVSSSDMRLITTGLSPRFCSAVEVKSPGRYPLSVYMLPYQPIIIPNNFTQYTYNKTSSLDYQTYEYWGYYMLEGSTVSINARSSGLFMTADYYFIKGWHNLKKWENDNYCSSCFLNHHRITTGPSYYSHRIYNTDEYFLVFANHQSGSALSISVAIKLSRTSYDLSSALHKCMNSDSCQVPYSGEDTSEAVVVKLPDIDAENFDITTSCKRRHGVFVALFFILPFGFGFIITAIIYMGCIRKKRSSSSSTPYRTLDNPSASQYSTFPAASAPPDDPPAYPQPPSYEESTNIYKN